MKRPSPYLGPLLLALALALPANASAAQRSTIPAPYHGHWSMTLEQCTADLRNDANIRVGARFKM